MSAVEAVAIQQNVSQFQENGDDDENSVSEEEMDEYNEDEDDEDVKVNPDDIEQDDDEGAADGEEDVLAIPSSQGEKSITEWGDDDEDEEEEFDHSNLGAQSQVARSFFQRVFFKETDVRFVNETDREVLFVIADEEFTIKRTTKVKAEASVNDDDDGGIMNMNFGLNLIPLSASAGVSHSTTVTQRALRTRCMPVAPRSNSTQHFHQERLTYVTALSKDEDGEGQPWTRVHYENKVINCQRTKSLKFCRKHLKVSAYRIGPPPPSNRLMRSPSGRQSSSKRLALPPSLTPRRSSSKKLKMSSSSNS